MKTVSKPSDLPRGAEIHIFGAGGAGRILFEALAASGGVKVAGFIDTAKTGTHCDQPIRPAGLFLTEASKDSVIVIASQSWHEIGILLASRGFRRVYNAYPIVRAHLVPAAAAEKSVAAAGRRQRIFLLLIGIVTALLTMSALIAAVLSASVV